jgi:hypothetical protein
MIGQHPELGAKKYGKILRISSIAEHDNGLALGTQKSPIFNSNEIFLGHSLKDSNIVAKVLHTDDEVLDEKTHKLYIEFEKGNFLRLRMLTTNNPQRVSTAHQHRSFILTSSTALLPWCRYFLQLLRLSCMARWMQTCKLS